MRMQCGCNAERSQRKRARKAKKDKGVLAAAVGGAVVGAVVATVAAVAEAVVEAVVRRRERQVSSPVRTLRGSGAEWSGRSSHRGGKKKRDERVRECMCESERVEEREKTKQRRRQEEEEEESGRREGGRREKEQVKESRGKKNPNLNPIEESRYTNKKIVGEK